MSNYIVVERENINAVHCITWSLERGKHWIETYGDSGMFMNKTLTKNSFVTIKKGEPLYTVVKCFFNSEGEIERKHYMNLYPMSHSETLVFMSKMMNPNEYMLEPIK